MVLFGFAVFPLRAEHLDLHTSTIRLIRDRYLYPETVTAEGMLAASVDHLENRIEWLMADMEGNEAHLYYGEDTPIGTVSVGGIDDLPRSLALLQELVAVQPYPLDEDLDLEVEVLEGAIEALDRPSTLLAGRRLESFNERLRGKLTGIGARIGYDEGDILVRSVFSDGPADQGGLRADDIIQRIDGISTLGMSVRDAVDRIRGPEDTEVVLTVLRGDRELELPLTRAEVRIPNLDHEVLDSGVALIEITHFSEQTVRNLRRSLSELGSQGALERGIILDLRGNTGGSMIQAARSADQFLVEGRLVRTEGRNGAAVSNLIRQMNADDEGTEPATPVVVLTDHRTASGSEILAGSLLHLERTVLIGDRTYGKGTVQKIFNMRADVRLKLTVAEYLLVEDVAVAGLGLTPDVPVGTVILDRNGVREQNPDPEGMFDPVIFVDERPGWRPGEDAAPHDESDPIVGLAERVVLHSRGPHRDDILAAARVVSAQVHEEQDRLLVETYAQGGIDWALPETDRASLFPCPEASDCQPGDHPLPVEVQFETDGPPRAGEPVSLRALVKNRGDRPLFRVKARITSENRIWDNIVLPVGRLDPGQGREGRRTLKLNARLPERLDEVSITVEAAGWPAASPIRQALHIRDRPDPRIAVEGTLVEVEPHARGTVQRARLDLTNRGREDLQGLRVHFDFPADEAIELLDREAFLPALPGGEQRRVDLDLVVKTAFEGDRLPLTLEVEAERYGRLCKWEYPLPLDGSTVHHEAPELTLNAPVRADTGDRVQVSLRARDDSALDFVVVYVNGDKRHYRPGSGNRLAFAFPVELQSGSNRIVAWAEDDQGHRMRRIARIYGDPSPSEPLASEASPEHGSRGGALGDDEDLEDPDLDEHADR